jgi:hypothetical protein
MFSPNQSSDLCLRTIISVFHADTTGVPSLEIVRLLNRMIKERRFKVHPNVLSCLVHLRLKTELGVRASETKADRHEANRDQKLRKNKTAGLHLSKQQKKTLKETKGIQREMKEAVAEVDKEERAKMVRSFFLRICLVNSLNAAHRNIEAPLCALFQDFEGRRPQITSCPCAPRHLPFCASR